MAMPHVRPAISAKIKLLQLCTIFPPCDLVLLSSGYTLTREFIFLQFFSSYQQDMSDDAVHYIIN